MNKALTILLSMLVGHTFSMQAQQELPAGTYYIQNKAAGTFLSTGATWGTCSVLSPHGMDLKVTLNDGSYTVITQILGASKALRPSDGYMDQSGTWTITPLNDGTYAMFNGTNYFGYVPTDEHPWIPRVDTYTDTQSDNTHWRFWTKEQLTETLSAATRENPVDATFFIQAPDILNGDYRITGSKVWGPDITGTGGNNSSTSFLRNNTNAEVYNKATFNATQTLRGIPNGVYSLSVQGFYRNGTNTAAAAAYNSGTDGKLALLYAGSKSIPLKSVYAEAEKSARGGFAYSTNAGYVPNGQAEAALCFDEGAYVNTLTNIVVTDGTLTIGIRKENQAVEADWTCFDNFTLLYYGSDLDASKQAAQQVLDDYAALNKTSDETYANAINQLKAQVEAATDDETINQILEQAKREYAIYASKPIPTEKALDLTFLLSNADLQQGTSGWNAALDSEEGYNQQWTLNTENSLAVLEAYAGYAVLELKSYALTQPVTLSPGIYRLKGYGFYRFGSSYNSDLNGEGEPLSYAFLMAGDVSEPVMRLGDIEEASSYPNTMNEAAASFAKGDYLNTLIFSLDEATTIDIGYQGTHTRNASWFIIGPLTLEKINEDILAAEQDKLFAQTKKSYASRWTSYKTISNQATDHAAFDEVVENAKGRISQILNQKELDEQDAEVWAALCTLIKTGTTASGQFDLTTLIHNPAFQSNVSGWKSQNALTWNDNGMTEEFGHTNGEFYQVMKNMPAGNYTLKVQAFHRPTSAATSNLNYEAGNTQVQAEMFLGSTSQFVKNINDDARMLPARPSSDVPGAFGQAIPNTLNGASDAFKAGLYWNVLRADIPTDGDLNIGLRIRNGQSANWLPFDNFRLYYGSKAVDMTLNELDAFSLTEDTYANVTMNRTLKPDRYNGICLPFDMPASAFESVWTLGGIDYNADEGTLTGTLIPAHELKAGYSYFVKVEEETTLQATDILVRALKPDSIPVLWEGGAMQGALGRTHVRRAFCINDDTGELAYVASKARNPGYRALVYLPSDVTGKARSITLNEIDFNNVHFTVNLENYQARTFLAKSKYASTYSASQIANYNSCPPARRDQPHTVLIPLPKQKSGAATLQLRYSLNPDMSNATTVSIDGAATQYELCNTYPQQHYYYQVKANGSVVTKGDFITDGHLRMIKVNSVSNVRDMGGWLTLDGNRLRYGRIYRGGEMNAGHVMNDIDRAEMLRLGIGAEVDLREDGDFGGNIISTSALGSTVPYLYLNLHMFGSDALEGYKAQYKQAFEFIMQNLRKNHAIYYHCIWGADRTGAMGFLLGGLAGMTFDQLYKDYELTSFSIAGLREKPGLDSKITYIQALEGETFQQKVFNYWNQQVGIPAADLLEFITLMTDGESSFVTSIHDVTTPHQATQTDTPTYFTPSGVRLNAPQRGINIVRTPDGKVFKFFIAVR